MKPRFLFFRLLLLTSLPSILQAEQPVIELWYGEEQTFGASGNPQPLINILGSIHPPSIALDPQFRLNGEKSEPFALGPDLHRLANEGDFNLEIERSRLRAGINTVSIQVRTPEGAAVKKTVAVSLSKRPEVSLPYKIDFTKLTDLQEAVEIVDGKWELTPQGARTSFPYYDRQLTFGDKSWKDYEIRAEVIFHEHFPVLAGRSLTGPPYLSHTHASFNLRWDGHPDDGFSPRRNWQNLGALVALRADNSSKKKGSYPWMHFGHGLPGRKAKRSITEREVAFPIPVEHIVHYRMRVETISDKRALCLQVLARWLR